MENELLSKHQEMKTAIFEKQPDILCLTKGKLDTAMN